MLYLSQAIGRPVLDANGDPIGKVDDLIVAVGDRYPPVTGLVVATDRRRIFLPWSHVARFDASGARLAGGDHRHHPVPAAVRRDRSCAPTCSTSRSSTSTGGKVVRVNDLRLDDVDGRCISWPWTSGAAGSAAAARHRGRVPDPRPQPAAPDARSGTSTGRTSTRSRRSIASIRLRVPHAGLTELHPADLATIIDQLAPRDRAGVLAALDDEAVADAIEEMEPETQVEVLEGLDPERAADILEEMSPDDAADLVADLVGHRRARSCWR